MILFGPLVINRSNSRSFLGHAEITCNVSEAFKTHGKIFSAKVFFALRTGNKSSSVEYKMGEKVFKLLKNTLKCEKKRFRTELPSNRSKI